MIDHGGFERFETPQDHLVRFILPQAGGTAKHQDRAKGSTFATHYNKYRTLRRSVRQRLPLEQVGALGGYLPPVAISAAQV